MYNIWPNYPWNRTHSYIITITIAGRQILLIFTTPQPLHTQNRSSSLSSTHNSHAYLNTTQVNPWIPIINKQITHGKRIPCVYCIISHFSLPACQWISLYSDDTNTSRAPRAKYYTLPTHSDLPPASMWLPLFSWMAECLVERAGSNRNAASLIFPRPVNSLSPGDREPSSDPFPQSYCRLSQRWWYACRCCCRYYYMLSYPYLWFGCVLNTHNRMLLITTHTQYTGRKSRVFTVSTGKITTHLWLWCYTHKIQKRIKKIALLFSLYIVFLWWFVFACKNH